MVLRWNAGRDTHRLWPLARRLSRERYHFFVSLVNAWYAQPVTVENEENRTLSGPRRPALLPTTPKGRRTRAGILAAGRRVIARDGYTDMRMGDVAEEAGLSMGGLYRYFDNKTSLFHAIVGDLHEELFDASRPHDSTLAGEPFAALLEANGAYLRHYYENRDVMRAFIEAGNVDSEFREQWWEMRRRHAERFAHAVADSGRELDLGGVDPVIAAEAMACMVEQCAYVWYAHEPEDGPTVPVDTASWLVTRAWYRMFFGPAAGEEIPLPDVRTTPGVAPGA